MWAVGQYAMEIRGVAFVASLILGVWKMKHLVQINFLCMQFNGGQQPWGQIDVSAFSSGGQRTVCVCRTRWGHHDPGGCAEPPCCDGPHPHQSTKLYYWLKKKKRKKKKNPPSIHHEVLLSRAFKGQDLTRWGFVGLSWTGEKRWVDAAKIHFKEGRS